MADHHRRANVAATPTPFPGRYVVVKQFTVDGPPLDGSPTDAGAATAIPSSRDTTAAAAAAAPLHYYNPFYLRLDLKTHSTRLLHHSIQQTSVDATPEHQYQLTTDVTTPEQQHHLTADANSALTKRDRCSIVSVVSAKKVAFADTVDVCDDISDSSSGSGNSHGSGKSVRIACSRGSPPRPWHKPGNVLEVHSQTGEVVGDILIERTRRAQPQQSVQETATADQEPLDDAMDRRKRHEMYCRRRQSPVYSCDDDDATAAANGDRSSEHRNSSSASSSSSSSSSAYESFDEDSGGDKNSAAALPVVVLADQLRGDGGPASRRRHPSTSAVNGYASCCPL